MRQWYPAIYSADSYSNPFECINSPDFQKLIQSEGIAVLRGFSIDCENQFLSVAKRFFNVKDIGVVQAEVDNPSVDGLSLHVEFCYLSKYPKFMMFYCLVAPEQGGETTLAKTSDIAKDIDPKILKKIIDTGVKYCINYTNITCVHKFITKLLGDVYADIKRLRTPYKSIENIKNYLLNQGFSSVASKNNDTLQVTSIVSGVVEKEQIKYWFNTINTYHQEKRFNTIKAFFATVLFTLCKKFLGMRRGFEVFYGDDSIITKNELSHIKSVVDSHKIYFKWQQGDVLIFDNIKYMHGRALYRGDRKILVTHDRLIR